VEVRSDSGTERFDRVVIATHSDQALRLLADPSQAEREVLGKIPYQENDTVLHTDEALLPRTRRARASWNYFIPKEPGSRASLTYNMNSLQSLQTPQTYCVTLNRSEAIQEEKILRRIEYHHPVYTFETLDAQKRYDEVSGVNRTFFCGAYWGHGFHEDGVNSALAVCKHFGKSL
jgi:predicted NAD/FAD-binding protein